MEVKVSSKHQVVIPKAIRKKMNLPKGDVYMVVTSTANNSVTFTPKATKKSISKYSGILKEEWGKDPVAKLRKIRDEDWD